MARPGDSRVTPLEHTMIGGLGGTIEVFCMQPMMAFKNAMQEGRPLPRTPSELYRGLPINAASMMPITATQFGTNRAMEQWMSKLRGGDLGELDRFSCALVAGAVSAFVASPTELIIIQQQKKGTPLLAEIKHFFGTHPATSIYRGVAPCIGREALYASGYLGLANILYGRLSKSKTLQESAPPGTDLLLSGIVGGVFAAAASQPFDTIKTRMQAFMYTQPEYLTTLDTARTIYNEGGVRRFWVGIIPRMTRIVAATFILNGVRTHAVGYLEKQRQDDAAPADLAAAAAAAAAVQHKNPPFNL